MTDNKERPSKNSLRYWAITGQFKPPPKKEPHKQWLPKVIRGSEDHGLERVDRHGNPLRDMYERMHDDD